MGLTAADPGAAAAPAATWPAKERALEDVEQVVRLVSSDHRARRCSRPPSWAAKLAVVYAAQRPAPLSGLLLLGPRADLAGQAVTGPAGLSPGRAPGRPDGVPARSR